MFGDVRSFEAFKFLHLGMISEVSRKSLPAIARAVGLPNDQVLHHCLTESPWSVTGLQKRRLDTILQQLNGQPITLVIDETGDRKKGRTTDYVDRQYIGNLGKIENGKVFGQCLWHRGAIHVSLTVQGIQAQTSTQSKGRLSNKVATGANYH